MPPAPIIATYQPALGAEASGWLSPSATIDTSNPLADVDHIRAMLAVDVSTALVIWSGWLGDEPESDTGIIEPDFRNWNGQGRRALDNAIEELLGDAAPGARVPPLWIRPHHRHVLSDGPSCAAFVRTHDRAVAEGRLALVLDLDLLVTPEMAGRREDHARRLVESAGAMGGAVAALVMREGEWSARPGALASTVLSAQVRRWVRCAPSSTSLGDEARPPT